MGNTGLAVQYDRELAIADGYREPTQVLEEARKAAKALMEVVALKKDPVIFNGDQYLELEDWQTVGKFYGLTPKNIASRYVEYGGVTGWEAESIVIDRNGNEVGRAESMCMSDEDNWGDVPVYTWEDVLDDKGKKIWDAEKKRYKGKRVQTGSKPKPMFQLRSMAQTRASAKALRSILSWVVVLAGFKPNVAEEMIESQLAPKDQKEEPKPQVKEPARKSDTTVSAEIVELKGIVEGATVSAKGSMWAYLSRDPLILIAVEAKLLREDMKEGMFLVVKGRHKSNKTVPDFYEVVEIVSCEAIETVMADGSAEDGAVEEGEYVDDIPADENTVTTEEVAGSLAELFQQGKVKRGSEVAVKEEDRKPGTIGLKRAQHLHITITQNHKKTGFTEAELKKVLQNLDPPIEHLRDLPEALEAGIKSYCTGSSEAWKE